MFMSPHSCVPDGIGLGLRVRPSDCLGSGCNSLHKRSMRQLRYILTRIVSKPIKIFRCPFESEQQWEDCQPGSVVARRIVAELIDSVLFTCCNPYTESWSESKNQESTEKSEYKYQLRKWSESEDMINVW